MDYFSEHSENPKLSSRRLLSLAISVSVVLLISVSNVTHNNLSTFLPSETKELEVEDEINTRRALSLNLGNGNCEWREPIDAAQDTPVFSTLLAAYPGSGKRAAFMQLEGVTELRSGDDYNLTPSSIGKKFAFMKSNYPQHEGIWSFGDKMDQSILLVRNPRRTLPSYQNVLHEIDYSTTCKKSYERSGFVYTMRPPLEDWISWREARFDAEIKKWGWFIDYWMEGGLLRDVFTNQLTTPTHFERLTQPVMYALPELLAAQESNL